MVTERPKTLFLRLATCLEGSRAFWRKFGTAIPAALSSRAGTNLKVGAHVRRESREKFFGVPLYFFGSTSTVSCFGELLSVQFSHFIVCFVLLLLSGRPCPAICKSGGTCLPHPEASAPLSLSLIPNVLCCIWGRKSCFCWHKIDILPYGFWLRNI